MKSLILDTKITEVISTTNRIGNVLANKYNWNYLGINDAFVVTGLVLEGEILGRISYFEYNDTKKAKSLTNKIINLPSQENTFLCSLVYFCSNEIEEKFSMTVLTVLKLDNDFQKQINLKAREKNFKDKIFEMSTDNLSEITFIGIESIKIIETDDIQYNVFETLYGEFNNFEDISNEVLSLNELNEILEDIFLESQ